MKHPIGRLGAILIFTLVMATPPVHAQSASPEGVVGGVIYALAESRKAKAAELAGGTAQAAARGIISRDVAPHMDFARISADAVGKSWSGATVTQRIAIEREFRQLLVHVLAQLLVINQADTLSNAHLAAPPRAGEAVVRVGVLRRGGVAAESMQVWLRQVGATWKAYELRVDGVDVVKLYGGNFAIVIERDGGLDGLIKALVQRNVRNAQSAQAKPAPVARPLAEDACLSCNMP